MMRAIEMSREDMEEIINNIPDHLKAKLKNIIEEVTKPDTGINVVKQFVEQYEDDNHLDGIISFTCASIIKSISTIGMKLSKKHRKEGKNGLTGSVMAQVVISCLRNEADNIEKALVKHDEECPHHCSTH
jgi:hypothetical protein